MAEPFDDDPRIRREPATVHARYMEILATAFVALTTGVAIGWFLHRVLGRKGEGVSGLGNPGNVHLWLNGAGVPYALPAPVEPWVAPALPTPAIAALPVASSLPVNDMSSSINHRTTMQSATITGPTLLCQAPADRTYVAHVRAVAPPGSFILVADNPGRLTGTVGDGTFVIPAGESHEIRLHPGQEIYARGSVANAIVSYSLAPELL